MKTKGTWGGRRHWKGITRHGCGYLQIFLEPDDFFYAMANHKHYVFEHRLVMAKYLGRLLQPWEIVHHKNGIRDDNRIENLELTSDIGHKQITFFEQKIKRLETRCRSLELENQQLKKLLPSR